ncbi:GPI ethanolamine phosphate transferase 1 [Coprinopsis marcescibilis]|uniref:GPI ethanolamine phosphate transferase 1 n=1 Tax=Coprinopsis marcescibilis TaxID=230819 RepID=A0A5C3L7J3_COPMA|nr:GPI ethanolamine phosphate transferase 1 [Coprinopsis marcescibilis]
MGHHSTSSNGRSNAKAPTSTFSYSTSKLLLLGFIFHVVFIYSVFDCYFTSPVVNGMKSFNVSSSPAKRLVLIVGDGLRADLLFNVNPFPNVPNSPKIVAPHLRSIIEERGAFGVSHTRVPTESRPGHVAIIAGMYEDVSAVTKGWKENPVDFDSVFNRSSSTYSFGSPDILPMFARGATPGKVKTWTYDAEEEDFTKDATALDVWVLDQLKMLLEEAEVDQVLNNDLRQDKVVFFLHLLGLDTTGHSYRPHSKEYMNNIQVVDDIVKQTETLINNFYGDKETSFIFTADHGMSVIGNHGDGHPDNTRTPLVAWGKGVRGPLPDPNGESHDDYSAPWELPHRYRRDVEQADIAPLMSALIGVDWPVNSVGVLPDADPSRPGYLDRSSGDKTIAEAAFVNAKMILEQYRVKNDIKKQHTVLYSPYAPLHKNALEAPGETELKTIETLLASGSTTEAKRRSLTLLQTSLQGLHYLQTYDRTLIRTIVTLAYTGWALFTCIYLFRPEQAQSNPLYQTTVNFVTGGTLLLSWAVFFIQKSPTTFYVYAAFPAYFWQQVLVHAAPSFLRMVANVGYTSFLSQLTFVVVCTQAMVLGYTHRSIWSVGLLAIAIVWPLTWSSKASIPKPLIWTWVGSCFLTAVFPLLPVDKTESLPAVIIGGLSVIIAGYIGLRGVKSQLTTSQSSWGSVSLIIAMMLICASSVAHLQSKRGLPVLNQSLGWTVLAISSSIPFTRFGYQSTAQSRILRYFLGFGPAFVVLSISVEGMFYTCFTACLLSWLEVERKLRVRPVTPASESTRNTTAALENYRFQADDLRIALFFLFFVQIGFFGTGKYVKCPISSVVSFYLAPVYRLIPIFSPFFMTALLIFKIVVPYVMLGVTFAELNKALQLPPFSLLLVALAVVDAMTLSFFFQVKDTGSWLEIGQSITFFCVTSSLLVWAALISAMGEYLMAGTTRDTIAVKSE